MYILLRFSVAQHINLCYRLSSIKEDFKVITCAWSFNNICLLISCQIIFNKEKKLLKLRNAALQKIP